jgi:hypothetical protein
MKWDMLKEQNYPCMQAKLEAYSKTHASKTHANQVHQEHLPWTSCLTLAFTESQSWRVTNSGLLVLGFKKVRWY